jgi:hypothetical protein
MVLGAPKVKIVGLESGTVFIKGDSMTESADSSIGGRERESARGHSDRANCIPATLVSFPILSLLCEERAYHTPTNSISTSIANAFLNALLWSQPTLSSRLNILYAKGTCWWFPAGSRPTYNRASYIREGISRQWRQTLWIMPARARAVYAPRENPKRHILSSAQSK